MSRGADALHALRSSYRVVVLALYLRGKETLRDIVVAILAERTTRGVTMGKSIIRQVVCQAIESSGVA